MIVVIVGIVDIFIALIILGSKSFPKIFLTFAAFYLIIKGLAFVLSSNIESYIDIVAGAYILIIVAGLSVTLINIILAIYLVYRGLTSFA